MIVPQFTLKFYEQHAKFASSHPTWVFNYNELCIFIYLFSYRDYPAYVGAVFPAKICNADYSAGIAVVCNHLILP